MNLTAWLRPYVQRPAEPHALTADDAAADLLDLALSGDTDAAAVCRGVLRDSLTRLIKSQRQAGHVTTLVAGARRSRVKTMPSQPVVDDSTGEQLGWSLTDLWDMTHPQVQAQLYRWQRERQQVSDRIAVYRAVDRCMTAHPECATAREAWLADGRSTDKIDLSAGAA